MAALGRKLSRKLSYVFHSPTDTGDDRERAVVFGCLAALGALLIAAGTPPLRAVLLTALVRACGSGGARST
jgi:hypothetical protein